MKEKKENILIVTIKSWNINNFESIKKKHTEYNWHIITKKENFNINKIDEINPKYIFFPHWSWIIPKEIHENYNCIVFHMTDLPFGRGGSPLQNLISRKIYETKISAIKVVEGIDEGEIYMKVPFNIKEGNADEILKKLSDIIYNNMIPNILSNNPIPIKQNGKIVEFKRRKPSEGDISNLKDFNKIFDFIRILDGEGYPPAFIETENYKIEFSKAKKTDEEIIANCKFIKKVKK